MGFVAPKIAGSVAEVLVADNQPVKAGDVLVRIDPRDFQAKVDLAKAALLQAESQSRAAQAAVPWTNDATRSGMAAACRPISRCARRKLTGLGAVYEQASGSDLAYAQAIIRARQANHERAQADLGTHEAAG